MLEAELAGLKAELVAAKKIHETLRTRRPAVLLNRLVPKTVRTRTERNARLVGNRDMTVTSGAMSPRKNSTRRTSTTRRNVRTEVATFLQWTLRLAGCNRSRSSFARW